MLSNLARTSLAACCICGAAQGICAGEAEPEGRKLYSIHCAACHGAAEPGSVIDIAQKPPAAVRDALREIEEMRDLRPTDENLESILAYLAILPTR